MAASVNVSVEVLNECLIQEVTLDGQEIYVQPLSMSENLTKLAHKIDFSKDESEEKGKPTSEGDHEQEEEQAAAEPLQPALWAWDSIWTKLKAASTELSVLQDVLTIARSKQYMLLDPIVGELEQKNGMLFLAKKKALGAAGGILLAGYERLRRSQDAVTATRRTNADFHHELLKLRQHWRLKKVGGTIIGDLSYKSAGSRYWQSGSFEVSKADDDQKETLSIPDASLSTRSALRVTVLGELEGIAYIQVAIRNITDTGKLDLVSADIGLHQRLSPSVLSADAHWQRKLEAAQNVVFCKEVFAQLAREAVQCQSQISHVVVQNQILSHLFPGVQLSISLCHFTDQRKPQDEAKVSRLTDHNHVLEHSLHQLLREVHRRNSFQPMPHPVSAILGYSKRRRLAGPFGYTREKLQENTQNESLLELIVEQARHIVVRKRLMDVIDDMAREIQDPQISAHISSISSTTESVVRVSIAFIGHDMLNRTSFLLHIDSNGAKAICKDGRVVTLSYDEQQLRDFILCQISQHYILSVQTSAKSLGWQVLSLNSHVGVGDLEPLGNAVGAILTSPYHDRAVCIRCGPASGLQVYVQHCSTESSIAIANNGNHLWSHFGARGSTVPPLGAALSEPWKPVNLSRTDGRNFVQKIESVMACLMPE